MYSHYHFPNQKQGEHVLMFMRRHWIMAIKIIAITLLFSAIPALLFIVIINYTNYFDSEIFRAGATLFISCYYLSIILYSFSMFIDYYLDVWIVTNQRVINIEQKGLFARVVSEKELERMQDITSEVKGFWATVLHYGDVHIQTAGETERFIFKTVPYADEVSRKISNLVSEYNKMHKNIPQEKI
ncbi:MAG: PH domain-containing protein [Patescibacteria group bacterium]